ncbi:tyrosine-type recombinase/integrase [Actinoplanes sp. NPDC023801]|uniref:tyrosine-type recombinase/integrase n=1 Tax=Actinoplanes sp. NPDC023801 TaxID=3154595 RepID=UPI003407C34E
MADHDHQLPQGEEGREGRPQDQVPSPGQDGRREDLPVDLDPETISVLRKWHREQAKERLALGRAYRNDENLVFTRADGLPLDPIQVYRVFKRLVERDGLPDVPLHSLRHEAASLQIEASVDIAVVSKHLRHSKISLTSDTYGHLIGTVGKAAAEAAAAVVPDDGPGRGGKIPTLALPNPPSYRCQPMV